MQADLGLGCKHMPKDTFQHVAAHIVKEGLCRVYIIKQGPVVQSVVSLTRIILLTVSADSVYNILIFFAGKM